MLGITASLLCLLFLFNGNPWAAILPQLFLLPHFNTWHHMVRINKGRELNKVLGETARNIALFGILLSVGLIL